MIDKQFNYGQHKVDIEEYFCPFTGDVNYDQYTYDRKQAERNHFRIPKAVMLRGENLFNLICLIGKIVPDKILYANHDSFYFSYKGKYIRVSNHDDVRRVSRYRNPDVDAVCYCKPTFKQLNKFINEIKH